MWTTEFWYLTAEAVVCSTNCELGQGEVRTAAPVVQDRLVVSSVVQQAYNCLVTAWPTRAYSSLYGSQTM